MWFGKDRIVERSREIGNIILKNNPDVVALQEVTNIFMKVIC